MIITNFIPHPKNGPRKNAPWKNVLQKLFSVKKMLGNLNDFFIFIDWFHYTHKKMFDFHLTILQSLNCKTLKESRKVCCRVLGFHRLSHPNIPYTYHDARRSPHDFFGDHFSEDHFSKGRFFQGTIFPGTIFPGDLFFKGPFFRVPFFQGTIFPGTIFPRDHFSGIRFYYILHSHSDISTS